MNSIKQKQISNELARVIAEILGSEARDELLKTITITGADVASDLSSAKVYFTSLSALDPVSLEKELKESAPYVRTLVAERMDLRHTPELRFIFDKSIEYGNKIDKIIESIHENDN